MNKDLTPEQLAEQKQITCEIVDEILDEEAWVELAKLAPAERGEARSGMRPKTDAEWLQVGSPEHRAAALLLGIYLRDKRRRYRYQLGNDLRGWFCGEYASDAQAWEGLSTMFNNSFPSRKGRSVELRKTIRYGRTAGGNETEADRLLREALEAERGPLVGG